MEVNELMLGNYLSDGKEVFKVEKAFFTLLELNMQFCKPIPLTEEWLLKFGFEEIIGNVENSKCFRHPKCSLIVYFDGTRLSVNFWQGNEKKHVHQLQNLYFALTGNHLTLK